MSEAVTIFHGADLHLDTPFSAADFATPAQRREQLRQAAQAALRQAADCDLIFLAGDVFDQGEVVYPETVEFLQMAFEALARPVFISPGNHDPYTPASVWCRYAWPGNVHIFRPGAIQAVSLPELETTVYGGAFAGQEARNLLQDFHADETGGLNLMVLHGDPVTAASPYNFIPQAQIAASGLNYLALGHLHAPSGLKQAGGTFYAWPGCLLGRDFGEPGQKSCYRVRVDRTDCTLSPIPTPGPRWTVEQAPALGDARAAVLAACSALEPGDHLRLTLTGLCPGFDPSALARACQGSLGSLELTDETTDSTSLWQGADQDTLRGAFLSQLRPLAVGNDPEQRALAELAAAYGLAALEGREEP